MRLSHLWLDICTFQGTYIHMRGTLIHLFEGDIHTYERVSMHTGCGSVHTIKSATAKGCGLPHRKGHSHTQTSKSHPYIH